ncbi:phosphatase PAP2 family protein [Flavobacteriaceae bacterium S0825]|uniref:phosphatase PAP2 family protein n=1 Tax=Gaetbulibacter sp. S0825 TaxID=2720084 RepID=UPI0014310BD6|nr:phosphatase PAP2 family protein [Gaetbulibacter sp. S0825]MCK0108990.1 phosphatase PAP2 family protein [Flavobacteriaceae bacterium S0825]NIX64625.1 phosphatase PAP2 family protein [Gaetbulibacter sp. S0825]
MIDQLLQYDTELFIFLNSLGSSTWDGLWLVITNKLTFIPLYTILLYLIYKRLGWKTFLLLVFVIAAMITFTDQITNLFKDGFQRPRPCRESELEGLIRYVAPRCGKYGFFSGHSSNSMAAAVFAGLLLKPYYKNLIFILLFWSAIVAYSRIYVGVHYPLDIVCGLAFGAIAGFIFYKLQVNLRKRFIS